MVSHKTGKRENRSWLIKSSMAWKRYIKEFLTKVECRKYLIDLEPLSKSLPKLRLPRAVRVTVTVTRAIPNSRGYTQEHRPYDPNSSLLHWLHIVISTPQDVHLGYLSWSAQNASKPT